MDLNKCIIKTCLSIRVIQSIVTALIILCALPIYFQHHTATPLQPLAIAGNLSSIPVEKITWRRKRQSGILAWEVPLTKEPGGLKVVHGLMRVRRDLVTK